ncbi:MAG: hypothetical protein AAB691_02185 [Patescibacteria group bacterium]
MVKKILIFFGLLLLVGVPSLLLAQSSVPTVQNACTVETPGFPYWGTGPSLLPCGTNGVNCLECGLCGLLMLGQRIIYLILSFLIFIIAPLRFIWGGFQIFISRGSSEMVSHGKKIIYQTATALVIALLAFVLIQTFLWLLGGVNLTQDQRLGWPNINCTRNLRP